MPINRAKDYIEHLKSKPEHVRERVAVGCALVVTVVVALGWMAALTSSGVLALSTPNEADRQLASAAASTKKETSNLLGAAAAFQGSLQGEGNITVVESGATSTLDRDTTSDERTVIPF
jgi:hypothetical protein